MKKKHLIKFLLILLFLIFLMSANIFFGSVSLSFTEVFKIISGEETDISASDIIKEIRIPRALSAVILGGALSVSGYLLQTFFNNPIAGPFVLGISSGAKMTVAFAMIISVSEGIILNSFILIIAAFAGSLISMGFVLLISGKVKSSPQLIVSGIMISYICSAITDLAVTFADDSNIVNLHNWSMGSFSGIDKNDVAVISAAVFPAVITTFILSKQIKIYKLGETYAKSAGLDIKAFRAGIVLLSSILSAVVTAFAGPVSFVGIAVPHLVKRIFKTSDPKIIIPASFLGGAVFCLLCDLLARTAFAPAELNISTVTAIFGAPVVIGIMFNKKSSRS